MKCDELKTRFIDDTYIKYYKTGKHDLAQVYLKSEADEAIAELKAEINRKEAVGKRWFERCMEARAENVMLKRALWIARADRANDRARIFYFNDLETKLDIDGFSYDYKKKKSCKKLAARLWRIIWLKVERKCRAKAEEYK